MFKIGDVVRVLTWEELCKVGSPFMSDGAIQFDGGKANWLFLKSMRPVCGKTFTISEIDRFQCVEGEYLVGRTVEADPVCEKHAPLSNFMVELAKFKYPTNARKAAHVQGR